LIVPQAISHYSGGRSRIAPHPSNRDSIFLKIARADSIAKVEYPSRPLAYNSPGEPMPDRTVSFWEVNRLDDDWLFPWLDLFETAMPAKEKILVSHFLRLLKDKQQSVSRLETMLAALAPQEHFVGLAHYQVSPAEGPAWLWYLAVLPERRNQGWGQAIYQALLRRIERIPALLFEVEIPDLQPQSDQRALAERRIAFYRRQGAQLLGGVHYRQVVGSHQAPIPMHIMAHAFSPISAAAVFDWVRQTCPDQISQVSALTLT
jgi:GNAT superfamily N-acetyltransferase